MTNHVLQIEINDGELRKLSASRLMLAWHLAQANPAPHGDHAAGELVERVGREIIRRWIGTVEPELWRHQGRHYSSRWLGQFAKYVPGDDGDPGKPGALNPEFHNGTWVARDAAPAPGDGDS